MALEDLERGAGKSEGQVNSEFVNRPNDISRDDSVSVVLPLNPLIRGE